MNTIKNLGIGLLFLAVPMLMASGGDQQKQPATQSVSTPFGPITMDGDIIAKQDVDKIYAELAFQQATQCYMWGIPMVSLSQWRHAANHTLGIQNGDIGFYEGYKNISQLLTANATTPYILTFVDLSKGPFVFEIPKQNISGVVLDMWQYIITPFGRDKTTKFLLLPPEGKESNASLPGCVSVPCRTNNVLIAMRVFEPDPVKVKQIAGEVKLYPYSQRNNPPQSRLISPPENAVYHFNQPGGMEYWERLNDIIQAEPVQERNMYYMAMLQNLGIEKGKPFNPTEAQKKALLDGAKYGEVMVQAMTYDKRRESLKHWNDRRWEIVVTLGNEAQRSANNEFLLERTAFFYEAVTFSGIMLDQTPRKGQTYLGTYTDKNGAWLDGGKNYVLHVPANPPVVTFWSATVYDVATRCLIQNEQQRADVSSRTNPEANADGSIDIYFGPKAPAGKEKNWIQTVPGKHWFTYFRFFGPTEAYFDKSWKMDDIVEIK